MCGDLADVSATTEKHWYEAYSGQHAFECLNTDSVESTLCNELSHLFEIRADDSSNNLAIHDADERGHGPHFILLR